MNYTNLRAFLGSVFIILGLLILGGTIDNHKVLAQGVQKVYVPAPTPPTSYTTTGPSKVEHRYVSSDCKSKDEDCTSVGQYQFRDVDNKIFLMSFCANKSSSGAIYPDFRKGSIVDITYERAHGDCYTFDYAKVISEPK